MRLLHCVLVVAAALISSAQGILQEERHELANTNPKLSDDVSTTEERTRGGGRGGRGRGGAGAGGRGGAAGGGGYAIRRGGQRTPALFGGTYGYGGILRASFKDKRNFDMLIPNANGGDNQKLVRLLQKSKKHQAIHRLKGNIAKKRRANQIRANLIRAKQPSVNPTRRLRG